MNDLDRLGWQVFVPHDLIRAWLGAALPAARAAVADPANGHWLRYGGTWFAGVNLLPNAPDGSLGGVGLRGPVFDAIRAGGLWPQVWDAAQISVVYPGYPRPMAGETDAAHRYRRDRDAAHLDGLLPVGDARRRMLRETHAFVLGLPLTRADMRAAPFVVWEGSHRVLGQALAGALAPHPPETWGDIDITDIYHAARRRAFAECPRRVVWAEPGGAYLVHRHALHGVAPWGAGAQAGPDGRMIAYFRPAMDLARWLPSSSG